MLPGKETDFHDKRKDLLGRAPKGVNDGDGLVFISHIGDMYPIGFLPVVCGNVRERPLAEICRNSPIMKQLRDKSLLKEKCGVSEIALISRKGEIRIIHKHALAV